MFCKICGTQNDQSALHCVRCGTSLAPTGPPAQAGAGWQNPAGAQPPQPQGYYPPQPQQAQYPPQGQMPPYGQIPVNRPANIENYFVQSLLVTLFCCLPLGIAAIVKSRDVDKMLALGNFDGAMAASKTAKNLCLFGLGGGVVVIGFYVVLAAVGALANH